MEDVFTEPTYSTMQPLATTDDLVTFEAFCDLVEDGQKADLIDGVIYMASPDSKKANSLNLFLGNLLDGYIAAKDIDGDVFISRYACRINAVRAPEPDVGYVRPERTHLLHETYMEGGPDIAVEIVSRDSQMRDYSEKRDLYETAGVQEYWIIDSLQKRTTFLRLRNGVYEEMALDGNIFRSEVLKDLWLKVDWLWQEPLPPLMSVLKEWGLV